MPDLSAAHDKLSETIDKYNVFCPVCKEGNWNIGRLDQDQLTVNPSAPRPPETRHVEAVCGTCGYCLPFRIAPLLGQWPEDEDLDQDIREA